MQTKSMTRLLRKDADSPSGFKIVGFEWHRDGKIYHGEYPLFVGGNGHVYGERLSEKEWRNYPCVERNAFPERWLCVGGPKNRKSATGWIIHDAFELGIKVGDEWWFEGDRILTDEHGWGGVLCHDSMGWVLSDGVGGVSRACDWAKYTKTGTIHDGESGKNER